MNALGDYADAADPDLLRARTFDAHPTGVADLFGLRLALFHESDAGHRLAEGTVKRLTDGDRLKARRMREDFWSFDPSHTFVMLTNHKPIVGGADEGIWRRLRLVPFEVIIPGDERDENSARSSPPRPGRYSRGSSPAISTGAGTAWPSPTRSPRRPRRSAPRAIRSAGSSTSGACAAGPARRQHRAFRRLREVVRR